MKDFFNSISRASLDADVIFEEENETIFLGYLDSSKVPEAVNELDAPAWSICKIEVNYVGGVKTYQRKYPFGRKNFSYSISEKDTYNYQFAK